MAQGWTRDEIVAKLIAAKLHNDTALTAGYLAMLAFHDGATEVAGKPQTWFQQRIENIEWRDKK